MYNGERNGLEKTTKKEHSKPELIFSFNSGNIMRTLARKMDFEFVLQIRPLTMFNKQKTC